MTLPRWRVRAQLRDTGKVMISDVTLVEIRQDGTIYLEVGTAFTDLERGLFAKLDAGSGEVSAHGDIIMLDHVTEFIATRV